MNNFLQIFIHIPGFIQKLKKTKIYGRKIIFFITDNMSKENLSKNQTNIQWHIFNYKYYYQEDSQEFVVELLKILNIQYSKFANSKKEMET